MTGSYGGGEELETRVARGEKVKGEIADCGYRYAHEQTNYRREKESSIPSSIITPSQNFAIPEFSLAIFMKKSQIANDAISTMSKFP